MDDEAKTDKLKADISAGLDLRKVLRDPTILATVSACEAHGLAVIVPETTYRCSDGSILSRKQLISLLLAKLPDVQGRRPNTRLVDEGIGNFELIYGVVDPFLEPAAKYCKPYSEDPTRAWALAREAAALPFRYSKNPDAEPKILDSYAANLLCFAIQIKRRLVNRDFGDVDGLLNMWGESGSGKTAFVKQLCSPFKSSTNQIRSLEKTVSGFDGLQVASALLLVCNDAQPVGHDYIHHLKEFITGTVLRTAPKFGAERELPIRCGLIVTTNKSPDKQYPDAAFTRRLFSWAWPTDVPFIKQEEYIFKIVPAWDAEAFWLSVPMIAPAEWRQIVHDSRIDLFTAKEPVQDWLHDHTAQNDKALPLSLRFAFQHFMAIAEDGNWPVDHISDRVFARELRTAGCVLKRNVSGTVILGLTINGHTPGSKTGYEASRQEDKETLI